MDRNLALELVRTTEAAALSAARWMGKGDAIQTDGKAFESMRRALESIGMRARVAAGRVSLSGDEAFTEGMEIGSGNGGPVLDLAVDPVECIDSVAMGRGNAMSAVAITAEGACLRTGDLYMQKLVVGPIARGKIDLRATPLRNLVDVASAKRGYVEDLTVTILDRERHHDLIRQVREAGARIHLIEDGDLAAAVATALGDSGVDVVMGTGSARTAVLAAAALACVGGDMQCRFVALRPGDEERILALTGGDPNRIYGIEDLLGQGGVMFAATGITDGDLLSGVRFHKGGASTHSIVIRQRSGTIRVIKTNHSFERKPQY